MAESAVSFLVGNLSSLLKSYVDVVRVDERLEHLMGDIDKLKSLLRDMQQAEADPLNLERQIKEVIYDLEDTLESWSIKIRAARCDCFINQTHGPTLDREIDSIRERRLEPLFRRIRAYADPQLIQKHSPAQPNKVPSVQINNEPPMRIENFFEDEANTLISYLMEETEEVDVISITGMPGIGKTMLAWKIYEDEMIRKKFPIRIWVDLPLEFSSKDLYVNILKEFTKQGLMSVDIPQESSSQDEDKLISAVEACLGMSRFLLVMDGVWGADSLRSVVDVLPKRGKVLITSRDRGVCVSREPHMLRFLNEKESWELLQLEVFGKLNECPETLKSVGECIAKKCDGSPLAIVVVASSLMSPTEAAEDLHLTKKWWKKVSENVTMYLTEYGQHHRLFSDVELSYRKLQQHLQDCFLYMGVFPEGREISVWKLTCLWIAEGFVEEDETAHRNLAALIDTNLVMVGKSYPNGQIRTCHLHKLIYGFCKYKAAEQDFYQEIKILPVPMRPDCRRLCIYSHPAEFLSSRRIKGQHVRSILCLNKEDKITHQKGSSTILKRFKFLRILECEYVNFNFPKNLSKLILLKYISLSCDDLVAIPETLSSLCCLETLVVDTQSPSIQLKANIWRMSKLRHLMTKAAIVLTIRGVGEWSENNVQTLSRLAPECCTTDVLTRAPNLKTLGIRGQLSSAEYYLERMECLQHLKLINDESPTHCQLHLSFIRPNCFPPNLKRLTLSATYLEWDRNMSVLGKIHSLEILKLKNNAFTGESWNTDSDGFPRLGFLLIATTDLVSWEASAHCFPALKCLVLKKCEKLHKIPFTLATSLHTLEIENIAESAVESAKQIQKGRLHELKLSIRTHN